MAWSEPVSATSEEFVEAWIRASRVMNRPVVEVPDGLMTADDGTLVAYRIVPFTPPASR